MQLNELTIGQLSHLIATKEITVEELTKQYLKRMEDREQEELSMQTVMKEKALERAKALDKKQAQREVPSSMIGIPMVIQDNICTQGILTTCGSKMLHNFKPPYNATVVNRLLEAGVIILGKTRMNEFAIENNDLPSQTTIGAAVAQGLASFGLTSDTGGQLGKEAALHSLVGFRATYGLVSRYGLIAHAPSMDQIGILTKDVADQALLLQIIAGNDPFDPTTCPEDIPNYKEFLVEDIQGMRIGLPEEYLVNLNETDMEKTEKTKKALETLGAQVVQCSLPHLSYGKLIYEIIATAELSSSLARYDGVRYGYRAENAPDVTSLFKKTRGEGFGEDAQYKILLGTYLLSGENYQQVYLKSKQIRALIKEEFNQVLGEFDCLLAPRTDYEAVSLAGLPALSMTSGCQLIGQPLGEGTLLKIAYTLEQENQRSGYGRS